MSLFIPTTDVFDVTNIEQLDVNSTQFKELIVRLQQRTNQIAIALNQKDTGIYNTVPFVTGQTFYPNPNLSSLSSLSPIWRQVYRVDIIFGALPNTGIKAVPHNIPVDATYTFVHIYGTSNNYIDVNLGFIPLPFSSPTLNLNIELSVDNTNVYVTTAVDYSNFTITDIVLEYIIN